MIKVYDVKIVYNKNDEKEMKALRCESRMDLLLVATLPTEQSILTTNSFQNHT